jgi:hypothetical protein
MLGFINPGENPSISFYSFSNNQRERESAFLEKRSFNKVISYHFALYSHIIIYKGVVLEVYSVCVCVCVFRVFEV